MWVEPASNGVAGRELVVSFPTLPSGFPPADPGPLATPATQKASVAKAAGSQVRARRPTSIRLPSGVLLPVDGATTASDGVLGVPTDINRAGWWDGSSRLGDPYGAIVVAAHVDSVPQGIGPFAELLRMRPGDEVLVADSQHAQRFRVDSVTSQPRTSLRASSPALSPSGARRLVLMTCGGPFDAEYGRYRDNVIVVATPRGGLDPI